MSIKKMNLEEFTSPLPKPWLNIKANSLSCVDLAADNLDLSNISADVITLNNTSTPETPPLGKTGLFFSSGANRLSTVSSLGVMDAYARLADVANTGGSFIVANDSSSEIICLNGSVVSERMDGAVRRELLPSQDQFIAPDGGTRLVVQNNYVDVIFGGFRADTITSSAIGCTTLSASSSVDIQGNTSISGLLTANSNYLTYKTQGVAPPAAVGGINLYYSGVRLTTIDSAGNVVPYAKLSDTGGGGIGGSRIVSTDGLSEVVALNGSSAEVRIDGVTRGRYGRFDTRIMDSTTNNYIDVSATSGVELSCDGVGDILVRYGGIQQTVSRGMASSSTLYTNIISSPSPQRMISSGFGSPFIPSGSLRVGNIYRMVIGGVIENLSTATVMTVSFHGGSSPNGVDYDFNYITSAIGAVGPECPFMLEAHMVATEVSSGSMHFECLNRLEIPDLFYRNVSGYSYSTMAQGLDIMADNEIVPYVLWTAGSSRLTRRFLTFEKVS